MILRLDTSELVRVVPPEVMSQVITAAMQSPLLSEKEAARYLRMDANKFRGLGLPVTKMHGEQRNYWSRATLDRAIAERTGK